MKHIFMAALTVASLAIAGPAYAAGNAAAGEAKAGPCAVCHGPNGAGTAVGPKLAGRNPAEFVQAMKDYKSGKRDNAMMKMQASQASDADMENLAAYFAAIK